MEFLVTAYGSKLVSVIDTETPGDRLRRIRDRLRISTREVARRSEGAVTHAYVSNLENGVSPWSKVSLTTMKGLARAYGMSLKEFISAIEKSDLGHDPEQKGTTVTQVPSSLHTLPTYRLVVPRQGKGEVVRMEDEVLPLDEELTGEFELYRLEEEGREPVSYIIRKQTHAKAGHVVVCDMPERGTFAAKVKSIQGNLYILETAFETFATEKIAIRGVAVYKHERLVDPNGVN